MSKKTDPQKKYWWLILVVVPLAVALIGLSGVIISVVLKPTPDRLPAGITITNNKFAGDMYFVTEVVNSGNANAQQAIQGATSLVQSKNYAGAIATLEQAAAQYQSPSIYNNLGVLYANLGNYAQAEQAYQNALRLAPNDQASNFNLGLLKQTQGKPDQAANYLAKAPDLKVPERTATRVPLAESSTQTPGLQAQLIEFTRYQNTITAKIRLINSSTKDINLGISPTHDTHLLEEATHKQYKLVDESNFINVAVQANSNVEVWAKYAVPAEDKFQSLSVNLGDGIVFDRIAVR